MSAAAPYCRTPQEMPDLRVWLRDRWAPGEAFNTTAAVSLTVRSPSERPDPASWSRWEHNSLNQSSLWWVSADMVDLLLATAAGVPDDVTDTDLQHLDHSGLIVFERPWWGIDSETPGHQVQVDALLWSRAHLPPSVRRDGGKQAVLCWSISMYRRLDFDAGLDDAELSMAVATGAFDFARLEREPTMTGQVEVDERGWTPDGDVHVMGDDGYRRMQSSDSTKVVASFAAHGCAWAPLGRSDWVIGDRIDEASYPMDDTMLASYIEDRKVLTAFWMLMHQEGIASRTEVRPPRQTVRRSERAGIDRALSRVNVVRLRRLSPPSEPGDDDQPKREHDHRWLVSGHWRWQPVGKGRAQRRLTFVRPHIKGPDDKPLVVREKVNAWVR